MCLQKRTAVDARLHNQRRFFLIQYVQILFIRHLNSIRTNHCAQVSAISTYHSERCLDDLSPGSRASRNDFPRHVFHPFYRSNFTRTESPGCRSNRSGMGRTPCLSSKYWRYTHIHNSAMPIIVLRENWLWRTSTRHRKNPNQSGVVAVDSCAFIQLFSQYRRLIALIVWLFTLLIMQNHGCLPFAWAKPVGSLFRTGKFRPGIAFTIVYKSVPFIEKRPRKPETGINDSFSCSSAWTILSGKTGQPFQIFRCSCFR